MIIADEAAMRAAGRALAGKVEAGDIILLEGPLGAGKTTFVRGLLAGLGHEGEVPSPSFALVQPYDDVCPPLWHVDLYRIEDPAELVELGLDEMMQDGVLVVEWPQHAGADAWPRRALALSIEVRSASSRALTAEPGEGWESRWPPQ